MSTEFAAAGAHFGNPLAEQRSLAAGEAVVELPDRAVVTITGPDRLSWLDSLTSQAVARLQPGDSAETLLLDPTGRLEHAMRVLDDGDTTWLLIDGDEGAPLAAWLDRMRFMLRVEVADRSADFLTVGAFEGTAFEQLAERIAAPNAVPLVWVDPWREVVAGGHQYSLATEHPASDWSYREALVPRDADLSDVPHAGTLALEALRVAAWRPRMSTEADERSIPHELDWLRSAVHLAKGCYRGQETVAKVHNLGHPPRRLVMLHLDGSENPVPPAAGSPVLLDGVEVGRVTSPALHFELGPVALAVIKRSVDPDAPLVVGGDVPVAASQELIVPTDAGAEANVPRLPKLGRVTRPAS
ncbi:CAF17-like 4Fe-4S cluster assembly/insertion protein YgfZ [Schumannella luteola]